MKPTKDARIRALRDMSDPELREKCRAVFGEETPSRPIDPLWKQVARRLQTKERETMHGYTVCGNMTSA